MMGLFSSAGTTIRSFNPLAPTASATTTTGSTVTGGEDKDKERASEEDMDDTELLCVQIFLEADNDADDAYDCVEMKMRVVSLRR